MGANNLKNNSDKLYKGKTKTNTVELLLNSDKLYKDNAKTKTVELLLLYYQVYTQTDYFDCQLPSGKRLVFSTR